MPCSVDIGEALHGALLYAQRSHRRVRVLGRWRAVSIASRRNGAASCLHTTPSHRHAGMEEFEGRAIRITYATHTSSEPGELLAQMKGMLVQQFPLRNVHWRPSPATRSLRPAATRSSGAVTASPHAIRTLQMLNVQLEPLPSRPDPATDKPVLARTPCMHLFFVACDDNEMYRTKVRTEIRNWIASLPLCMPQDFAGLRVPGEDGRDVAAAVQPEYLLVLVPPRGDKGGKPKPPTIGAGVHPAMSSTQSTPSTPSKGPMGRFYNINKGTVLEKLKADFNSSTHERVVHLSKLPANASEAAGADPTIWIELVARMKEGVANTIGNLVELQDRSISSYQTLHGRSTWTFCGSLARTERLVDTLEGVELLEDSLLLYEELEQRLSSALADGSAHFEEVGGAEPGDDSLLLLGPLRKPYQARLEKNTISLFDLRCYLFSRKAMLLGTLGHVVRVMQSTPVFIASIAQMYVRRPNPALPRFFIESWSFSVSLDSVEQCQAWLVDQTGESADEDAKLHAFHSCKAELLELAIRPLIRLGIWVGHLPSEDPFTLALAGTATPAPSSERPITRKELTEAMASRDVFDSQLRNLIQRSMLAASLSRQDHRQFRLKYVLACLDLQREAYTDAARLLAELLAAPKATMWGPLHEALLARYFACLAAQGLHAGPAWIQAHVTALEAMCATRSLPYAPHILDEAAILQTVTEASDAEETDTTLVGYNGLRIVLAASHATRKADDDGAWLAVDVVSMLSFPLAVTHVGVSVANYRQEQRWFRSEPCTLAPGTTRLSLYCPMPAHGYFHLQTTQVCLGKHVLLEQVVQGALSLSTLADAQQHEYTRPRIFLPADGDHADVRLVPERHVRFTAQRHVLVEVHAGRNAMDATLQFDPGDGVEIAAWDAAPYQLEASDGDPHLAYEDNQLTLRQAVPHSVCRIALPLVAVPRTPTLEINVTMDYHSAQSHPECKRTVARRMSASMSLPLGIHIQDHFRLDQLFSKLTLESSHDEYARISVPQITAPEHADLAVTVPASAPSLLIPQQPSTFVVRFAPKDQPRRTRDAPPFQLEVAYRCLDKEMEGAALHHAAQLAWDADVFCHSDTVLVCAAMAKAARRCKPSAYTHTGSVALGAFDEAYWQARAEGWGWAKRSPKTLALLALAEAWHERPPASADLGVFVPVLQETDVPVPPSLSEPQRYAWEQAQACLAWRRLSLPLDVPLADAVAAVSSKLALSVAVVGEPVQLEITIRVSLRWGAQDQDANDAPPIQLQYNLLADYVHWVVQGEKKGTLVVPRDQTCSTHTIQATLLPVHAGSLLYPRVRITAGTQMDPAFQCESYMTNSGDTLPVVDAMGPDTYWVDLRPSTATAVP